MKNEIQQIANDLKRFVNDTTSTIAELRLQLTQRARLSIVTEMQTEVNYMKEIYAKKSELDEVKQEWDESRRNLVTNLNFEEQYRGIVQSQEEIRNLLRNVPRIFPFERGTRPKGIINYLKTLDAGAARDGGLFDVTASSISSAYTGRSTNQVTDFESYASFCSEKLPDQWIRYDFKTLRARVTHYLLRSFDNDAGTARPKSWVLEGCDDGEHWIELDRRSNNNQLNGRLLVATFDVSTAALCRFIRLRQTGPNHAASKTFILSEFELFGTVVTRVV
jgi:hypothetical protein